MSRIKSLTNAVYDLHNILSAADDLMDYMEERRQKKKHRGRFSGRYPWGPKIDDEEFVAYFAFKHKDSADEFVSIMRNAGVSTFLTNRYGDWRVFIRRKEAFQNGEL